MFSDSPQAARGITLPMAYLNWSSVSEQEFGIQTAVDRTQELQEKVVWGFALSKAVLTQLTQELVQNFETPSGGGGGELRIDLPRPGWKLFVKTSLGESRFLIAHPEPGVSVATLMIQQAQFQKLRGAFGALLDGWPDRRLKLSEVLRLSRPQTGELILTPVGGDLLVVEDVPEARIGLLDAFKRLGGVKSLWAGMRVREASSSTDLRREVLNHRPQFVLMDEVLEPTAEGVHERCDFLRQAGIPFVLTSAREAPDAPLPSGCLGRISKEQLLVSEPALSLGRGLQGWDQLLRAYLTQVAVDVSTKSG